ncbi:MAG: hypothetical protein FWE53_01280 [Firmicutes bacterium]|nr:hypothetical protein [Bacillota bacterium]
MKGESGGVINVFNEKELPTDRDLGRPNARYDLIVPGGRGPNGQKRSRWTDPNGRPRLDKDYNHGGNHKFPHLHEWIGGIRQKEIE